MPLTRDHVTPAAWIMLHACTAFYAGLGINYLTAQQTALDNPALAFADDVMPLDAWGCMFLACSALMVAALATKRRILYRFALRVCAMFMVFWAVIIGWASTAGEATPLAAIWAAFVATACFATDRSLADRV